MPITSSHHNFFVSSHHCALIHLGHDGIGGIFLIRNKDLSYPHSPWRARRTAKRFDRRLYSNTRLGGENPRQNENIALEPRFGKGKLPRCSRTLTLTQTHTHSNASEHEPAVVWLWYHTLTPLRFRFPALAVCVWVDESRSLMKNFQFQNGDRCVFATAVFGSSGNVSKATLRGRVSFFSTDCT